MKEGVKMSKSKISNQNKKIKQKKEKFLPGEKIKDIEIDLKSYKQFSIIQNVFCKIKMQFCKRKRYR